MDESNINSDHLAKPREPEVAPPPNSKAISTINCIVFGVSLGGCLGLLSSAVSIGLLQALGRPDALVRPAWEDVHIVVMVFCGCLAGILYGAFFSLIAKNATRQIAMSKIFLLTLLMAFPFYLIPDYLAIICENPSYSFFAHPVVFAGSLTIAYLLSRKVTGKNYSY